VLSSLDDIKKELREDTKKKKKGVKKSAIKMWIDVFKPSEEEISAISKLTRVPKEEIEICLDPDEKPRIEINKELGYNLIIVRVPLIGKDFIATTTLGMFFTKDYLLTVHTDKVPSVREVYNSLKGTKHTEFNPLKIIHSIVFHSVNNYSKIFDSFEKDVDKIEETIFSNQDVDLETFLSMKESLIYFRKGLAANRDVLALILKKHISISDEILDDFEDLKNDVEQLIEIEDILRDRIASSLDVYLSISSNRMNETMKTLTILATLFVFPTLVSSIYGMNFKYMPLINHPYGFWFSLLIMIIGILILLVLFKKTRLI